MSQVEPWVVSPLVKKIKYFAVFFMVAGVALLSLALAADAVAQKILIQDGFENHPLDKLDKHPLLKGLGFKITNKPVKTGKKSFAISGKALVHTYSIPIRTNEPITSVECWVYIEKGGRSFSLKLTSDDESFDNRGPNVGWDTGFVQFYAHDRWQEIGKFATNEWRYIRIVANFDKNVFDFYSGGSKREVLRTRPKERIPFRMKAAGPAATSIVFSMERSTVPGYIDDLIVYEGENPIVLAVEPSRKLATVWGHIKQQ